MGKRLVVVILVLILAGMVVADSAFAEFKVKWGPYLRVRHEYWKNIKDMDSDTLDNRSFFRFKSSIWGQIDKDEDFSLYAKLTNEFKAYTYFAGTTGAVPDKTASKKGYHFDINEIVFDNLYVDIKKVLDAPVNLRIGRQDFLGVYGEGFLIMDGTPQDGSRTFYFNAAKASWRVNDKNTVDVIYILDPREDEFLPVINRRKWVKASNPALDKVAQALNTTDEQAQVLYWKNKDIKDLSLEGYYIYKKEAEEGGAGIQSQECKLNTFGSFAKYDFAPWAIRGQFAYQTGEYGENDREAEGGYVYLDRSFKDVKWSPKASAGYIYLSGDNPKTSENESWDPLFSRWPWISELYVSSIASDTGNSVAGYWTNVKVARAEFSMKPTEKLKLTLWYNHLWAANNVAANTYCTGTSRNRGYMPQGRVDYAFNKNVSAYVLVEYLQPGDFYKRKDASMFVRTELQVKF